MVGSDGECRAVISIDAVVAAGDIQLPDIDRQVESDVVYYSVIINNKEEGTMNLESINMVANAAMNARSGMVRNRAGGLVCSVTPMDYLDRILLLGTTHNTYYASGAEVTGEAVSFLVELFNRDPQAVDRVVQISQSGRAPSNSHALMALAIALSSRNDETKDRAVRAFPKVARTGADFLHLVALTDRMRRWSRSFRRAVQHWFLSQNPDRLAYQAVKYPQRSQWTMRDVVRLGHPLSAVHRAPEEHRERIRAILYWIAKGWPGIGDEPHPDPALRKIWAVERLRRLPDNEVGVAARLIAQEGIPREAVPTNFLRHQAVWDALLPQMPMMALVRNLATLTRKGIIGRGSPEIVDTVCRRLTDRTAIRMARLHPVHYLMALRTYAVGYSKTTGHRWDPVPEVVDALERGFILAFQEIEPSPAEVIVAVDVSGSMSSTMGIGPGADGLRAIEIGAVLAMSLSRSFPNHRIWGFNTACFDLCITPEMGLQQVVNRFRANGGTDISTPVFRAMNERVPADALVIVTDNETWKNREPVHHVMDRYRESIGRPVALVVIATSVTEYSVASQGDPLSLNIAGFDSNVTGLTRAFIDSRVGQELVPAYAYESDSDGFGDDEI